MESIVKKNSDAAYTIHAEETIFSKQLQILNRNLLISLPTNLICAITVTIALYYISKPMYVWNWFACAVVISLLRILAFYFYDSKPQYKKLHYIIFMAGMILSACLWGWLDSFGMPRGTLEQMVVIIVIAGITSGGSQTLNANLVAGLLYVTAIILPLCIWVFMQPGVNYLAIGIAMSAYLIFMLVTCVRGYKLLKTTLNLAYENLSLVESLSEANQKLVDSYKILEEHDHTMTLITKMNDLLQTCNRLSEAYSIIIFTAKSLFADFQGGLVISDQTTKTLKKIDEWGDEPVLKSEFSTDACWALRKGHAYCVNNTVDEFICYHFTRVPTAYICIPLLTQSGIIGLLVLYSDQQNSLTLYHSQLLSSFSEVIKLTLSNIKLREDLYEKDGTWTRNEKR